MFSQIFAVFLYLAFLIAIGLYAHKKNTSRKDFALEVVSSNFWVTAISAHADDMSSWLFMAFPMTVFITGGHSLWVGIGLIVGIFFNWHLIAPKLRIETEKISEQHSFFLF